METYTVVSLETHLFFARIMKEHALFLEAGFLCIEKKWIERADCFREKFETLLCDVVKFCNGRVRKSVLESDHASAISRSCPSGGKSLYPLVGDGKIESYKKLTHHLHGNDI